MSVERSNFIQEYINDMQRELGYKKWQTVLFLVAFVASLIGFFSATIGIQRPDEIFVGGSYDYTIWHEIYQMLLGPLVLCVVFLIPCRYWIEQRQRYGSNSIWVVIYGAPLVSFITRDISVVDMNLSQYPQLVKVAIAGFAIAYLCLLAMKHPLFGNVAKRNEGNENAGFQQIAWYIATVWPIILLLLTIPMILELAFQSEIDIFYKTRPYWEGNVYRLHPNLEFAFVVSVISYMIYSVQWDSAHWKQHSPYANLKKPQEIEDAS